MSHLKLNSIKKKNIDMSISVVRLDQILHDEGLTFEIKKENSEDETYVDEEGEPHTKKKKIKPIDNKEKVLKKLEEAGIDDQYTIFVADGYTIQVDIDNKADFKTFCKHLKILQTVVDFESAYYTVSKSGRIHVTLKTLSHQSVVKKIAIQSILGSDRLRELMNFKNVKEHHINPILFVEDNSNFEKKKIIDLGIKHANIA